MHNLKQVLSLSLGALLLGQTTADSDPVVSSLQNDLDYDDNGKLASYYFVYPAHSNSSTCDIHDYDVYFEGVEKVALTGEALKVIFPNSEEGTSCEAAFLERGVDKSLVEYPMPHKRWNSSLEEAFKEYVHTCAQVEVCLLNYVDRQDPIRVSWMQDGKETDNGHDVQYGEQKTKCFHSFIGHQFRASLRGETVEDFTVEFDLTKAFGISPPHHNNPASKTFEREIESTLRHEWDRKDMPKRTFSPLGFSKGRLPNDVFGAMGAFYYNNRQHKVREEWNAKGVFVNWYETDVFFIQVPWSIKNVWQQRLADLVSIWAGTKVEQTVMYGLRQYEHGARLLTHVDRLPTHAVSLIVNIAQGNLTEEWPVEVFDHHGRLHEVPMAAGDIVYYESAKNLHSRNRVLTGENAYYVNLFTHYRPAGDGDKWHELPSAVDGLGEAEGECKVPDDVLEGGEDAEHLGFGRVRCDDPRLGRYVSPTLFRATDRTHLLDWWKHTSPQVQKDAWVAAAEAAAELNEDYDYDHTEDEDDDDDHDGNGEDNEEL